MEHVRLSPAHAALAEARVARGDYPSADAYVAALIDAAEADARARLAALLREGLATEPLAWTPAVMEDIRRRARAEP